jgi:hypothetical protein
MHAGLKPLIVALEEAPARVSFFLRDDDAGWHDARLFELLDATQAAGVPVDLAVIPEAAGPALARSLQARMTAAPGLIGVHQHGFAHRNHEGVERKCEFGAGRCADAQRRDLSEGRERLRRLFGARLDDIFTPPWNRCSDATPALLADLGYAALSRSRGATAQLTLPELPIDVDWCRQRRLATAQGADGVERVALELARRVSAGGPAGLMLHHAEMSAFDLTLLDALLVATRHHPNARWQPMRELLPGPVDFHADSS